MRFYNIRLFPQNIFEKPFFFNALSGIMYSSYPAVDPQHFGKPRVLIRTNSCNAFPDQYGKSPWIRIQTTGKNNFINGNYGKNPIQCIGKNCQCLIHVWIAAYKIFHCFSAAGPHIAKFAETEIFNAIPILQITAGNYPACPEKRTEC